MRIVLVHGAATGPAVWRLVRRVLEATPIGLDPQESVEVLVPHRPRSGDLETEVAALRPLCEGAFLVGVSGGATLGLEIAARGAGLRGAMLHEPAAGSYVPHLLDGVADALAGGGVAGFGRALYGERWAPAETDDDLMTVRREFAMFAAFEPRPPTLDPGRILVTTGERSPPPRHEVCSVLAREFGVRIDVVRGCAHAAPLEAPVALTRCVAKHLGTLVTEKERSSAVRRRIPPHDRDRP